MPLDLYVMPESAYVTWNIELAEALLTASLKEAKLSDGLT